MMHLISYDIQHDHLRLQLAKLLLRSGCYRIQYSVFMGTLTGPVMNRLQKQLQKLMQSPHWTGEDSVIVLPLHQYSEEALFFLGKAPEDWDMIQQNLHTLVL